MTEPVGLLGLPHYAGSGLILRLIRLIYSYAKPKFLEPAALGVWNILNLVPTYSTHLHLGARTALEYRVPKLLGEEKTEAAERAIASVFWFSLAANLALSLVLALLAVAWADERTVRWGLAAMAVLALLVWYHDLQLVVLKGKRRFDLITRARMINAAGLVAVAVPMVVWLGIFGVFAGALIVRSLVVVYLANQHPLKPSAVFDRALLFGLVRQGLPILVFTIGLTLLTTADRLIIAALLDTAQLGLYAVALVAAAFILQIPVSARDMREPELMRYLAREDRQALWERYFLTPLLNTAWYFPLLMAAVAFLAQDVLRWLLPTYIASGGPATVLCFGSFFLALVQVMRGMLVAGGWQTRPLPIQLLAVAINAGLSYWLIGQGWGITGVALASSISFAVVFVGLAVFMFAQSPYGRSASAGHLLFIVLPFILSVGAVYLLETGLALPAWPHEVGSVVRLSVFGLSFAGGVHLARWRYPMIRRFHLRP